MKNNNTLRVLAIVILTALCVNCNEKKNKTTDFKSYFEGEITLSESRGLYGDLFKIYTTFTISENYIKREQKLGGIASISDNYAGIIIDLENDSVTLYYADELAGIKNKHTTNSKNFRTNERYKNFPGILPSPIDNTFNLLSEYNLVKQIKDSITVKGFKSDYTLYKDKYEILKHELFDTKDIKIKRELLEMIFPNIPSEINFPLKAELKTTISDISNDSIICGQFSWALDSLARSVFQQQDSIKNDRKTDLEKLAKNKWVNLGLDILKKGIDLNVHITIEIYDLSVNETNFSASAFPSADFEEISDIDDFIGSLPDEEDIDFDD